MAQKSLFQGHSQQKACRYIATLTAELSVCKGQQHWKQPKGQEITGMSRLWWHHTVGSTQTGEGANCAPCYKVDQPQSHNLSVRRAHTAGFHKHKVQKQNELAMKRGATFGQQLKGDEEGFLGCW